MTWSSCGENIFLLRKVGRKWKVMGGDAGKFIDQESGTPFNTDDTFALLMSPTRTTKMSKTPSLYFPFSDIHFI